MFEVLGDLSRTIQDIIRDVGYPGITFIMFLEYVFPPIPSELVLPFSGFLVGQGDLNFWGVWVASIIGSIIGSLLLYFIGLKAGDPIVRQFLRRYGRWVTLSEKDYDRTLRFFDTYGEIIVFTGRLIPVVRSLVSLPAGADRMPMRKFLPYTFLGSAVWNGILIFAGKQLGDNWEKVMNFIEKYQKATIAVIAVAVIVFLGYRIITRLRASNQQIVLDSANDPAE
jgi:membrane protein DedA with SNARE-associated domain